MRQNSRRSVKIPNPERLRNVALYYLSRYAASENSLRRVLQNRLRRAALAHPDFAADLKLQGDLRETIEQIIASHVKTGAVNDAFLADVKVASLRRGGKSTRFIRQKLAERGLGKDHVARALQQHDGDEGDEEADLKAALAHAKKRRLGPFRTRDADKEGIHQKDFANLARAGFSANVIRKILKSSGDEDFGF